MIHYHGTPITPREKLLKMAGSFFCVSFARPDDVKIVYEIAQGVMIDNGAFSVWKLGRSPDWPAYYRFCEKWLEYWTSWAVIPDSIEGGVEENDELIEQWPFGRRGAPVWHLHEPLGRLERLVDEWPLVCLGSSGEFGDPGSPAWHGRMARAMEVACDDTGLPKTRLHMLRGLRFAAGPYPFFSADSTNVARNHARNGSRTNGSREDIFEMTRRLDAVQPPVRWNW